MDARQYVKEVRQLVRIASREGNQDVRDAMETAIRGYVYSNQLAAFEQAQTNMVLADDRRKNASVRMVRAEQALDQAAFTGKDAVNCILDYRNAQDEYRAALGEWQSAMYWIREVQRINL